MKSIFGLFIVVILLCLYNCGSNLELLNNNSSLLIFSHEGEEYQIIGYSPTGTEGYNYLIRQKDDEILIKCIDKQQDGILDEVILGNISLENANTIYSQAISIASSSGSLKEKNFEKFYITSDRENIFELRTYVLADGDIYNIFAVKPIKANVTYITKDLLADGELDYFEEGEGDLKLFQSFYDEVMQKGLQNDKIVVLKGSYQVMK
jgi:hypothetical protein